MNPYEEAKIEEEVNKYFDSHPDRETLENLIQHLNVFKMGRVPDGEKKYARGYNDAIETFQEYLSTVTARLFNIQNISPEDFTLNTIEVGELAGEAANENCVICLKDNITNLGVAVRHNYWYCGKHYMEKFGTSHEL